ncbi:hypothetical protein ACHHYP_04041 [Achlya hypogyna]|uniref:PH domain-containing protein n=1 Tax=Achlya hypogyna TaxID=1202772 RepID=A0A1V9Z2A8_ACHHY|nr:hypothetical protein ACHHYP_04041 [Achlya hypogyna]
MAGCFMEERSLNSAIVLHLSERPDIDNHTRLCGEDNPVLSFVQFQETAIATHANHGEPQTSSPEVAGICATEVADAAARRLQGWYRHVANLLRLKSATTHAMDFMKHMDRDLLLFWKLLHEGIRVCKYKGSQKKWKIISLNSDGDRLVMRPLHSTSMRLLTSPLSFNRRRTILAVRDKGLFLRDIAEVRAGTCTVGFTRCKLEASEDQCFSIVGSERTWDLELPTPAARDQAVARLRGILDVLQDNQAMLANRKWATPHQGPIPVAKIERAYAILVAGIQVTRYMQNLVPALSFFWINPMTQRACIGDTKACVLKSVHLDDVGEIRLGINSVGFGDLAVPPPPQTCFSVIGTEGILECSVPNEHVRDAICVAFCHVLRYRLDKPGMSLTRPPEV